MSLLYAVALFSVSAALLRVLYVGSHMPKTPWWARESTFHVVLPPIIGMISFGVVFLGEFALTWKEQVIGLGEAIVTAAIVAVSVIIWLLMDRVSLGSTEQNTVVPMPQPPSAPVRHDPSSSSSDRTRKAA